MKRYGYDFYQYLIFAHKDLTQEYFVSKSGVLDSYAKELFIDEAVLFGYLDGDLEHGSIQQFYDNVDSVAAGDEFNARIDVLLLEETLAVVRVLEESWGGRIDFTNVLLMLKMDGEWKAVAKAYNQNSNTIQ